MSTLILDPIIQKFVDALAKKGGKPLYTLSPADARKVLDDLQKELVALQPADSEDRTITGPHGPIHLRIVRPKGNTQVLPVIIYIHGGGWILGNKNTHDRLVREIANGTQAAIVFVDYTPAPEGQYPLAHEQGYAAAQWAKEHSKELNIDSSRMVIMGDSVGGLMATAIAMMAQERGSPQFKMQVLFYPVTDANFDTPSYKQFADGPWLTKPAMEWFWDAYVPNKADRKKPLVAPLQASLDQLKKLPPALIFLNENDVLRDEGEAYARKLIQAGVPVAAFRTLGVIHDCLLINAITQAPAIRAIITAANKIISEAFEKRM
jgi:acetyl esterase